MRAFGLSELAEDPDLSIEPPAGSQRVIDDRYCLVIGPRRRWANVSRLRLTDQPDELDRCIGEIQQQLEGIAPVSWSIGSSATPTDLPDRLRRFGLRAPDPPLDPVCVAMTLTHEPPAAGGVSVSRITTLEEHHLGLEIMLTAARWTERAATQARASAEETFRRRSRRGGFHWLVWLGGEPVACGLADRSPAGLFLAGGATLPGARGQGCYRALVRARWEESVALGLGGLAVHAQYATSAPILRRLGFAQVAVVHTLQSTVRADQRDVQLIRT